MRGASALGEVLSKHPAAKVRVLVVWEPVISTDLGPPTAKVRAPLRDPRVVEFWDERLWMSPRVVERAGMIAAEQGTTPVIAPGEIAWDFVARFPAGAKWEDPFPVPDWYAGPVVDAQAELDQQLGAAQ